MVNAQHWLDKEYPKNNRNNVTELKISVFELRKKGKLKENVSLDGLLKVEGFTNLEEFDCYNNDIDVLEFVNCPNLKVINCSRNNLESLNVQKLPNLEKLYCSVNLLTTIDLSQNIQLKELEVENNGFQKQDLSFLSHLINLEKLNVGNRDLGPYWSYYNKFCGSLKPLQNLTNLQKLNISNTNISRGLEYLPSSVSSFDCWVNIRGDYKVEYLSREVRARKETQEEVKNRIKDFLPKWNLTEILSKMISEAKETNTLEGYRKLAKEMPFSDVRDSVGSGEDLNDSTHMYFSDLKGIIRELAELEKIENDYEYRKKIKDELKEKVVKTLSKVSEIDENRNLVTSLKNQLNELEVNFEQHLKGQKSNWNKQLKEKRVEVTRTLSSGKGSNSHVHKEIKELKDKIENYENLIKELQLSRNILTVGNNTEEIFEDQQYLNNSLQELQKKDDESVWEGFYQVMEILKARQKRAEETFKSIDKQSIREKTESLKKHVILAQKLTQKLLTNQQLEARIESSNN